MTDILLNRLDESGPRTPGIALLLGDAARFEPDLESRGWDVRREAAGTTFGVGAGASDLVIAENVLVRGPWDRWTLQRIHAALRTGGRLLLAEPNQLDLSTASGVLYVASRGAREVGRKLRRTLRIPQTAAPSLAGRKPSMSTLGAMLAPLRFERLAEGYDRRGGWAGLVPAKFARRIWLEARTRPVIAGKAEPWPGREAHVAAYERSQAHLLATRGDWTRRNPGWAGAPAATFDPSAYAGRTVLVLAPHPDDEVIGAGGALLQLVRAGARVVGVQATDGSAGAALEGMPDAERREVRLREAAAVGARIGLATIEFWRADNGDFRATPDLVERMRALLERERPALVLLPFVTEAHADHLTLCVIFARALAMLAPPAAATVLGYEVWSLVPPTHVLDITPVMEELESLLLLYDCAMRVDDFVHFCADRALWHGFRERDRAVYLEAFHAVPAARYPELLATVTRAHVD